MYAVRAAKRIEEEIERLQLDKMLPSLIMDDMLHVKKYTFKILKTDEI